MLRHTALLLAVAAAILGSAGCQDDAGERPPRVDAFRGCPGELDAGAAEVGEGAGEGDGGPEADAGAGATAGTETDAAVVDAPGVDAEPSVDAPLALDMLGGTGPKVLLISVDGLRPDGIIEAPAVNLLNLSCVAAYSWQARTISPSLTLPSHASMVSGFPPEAHGLIWNDWRPGYIPVPTVFQMAYQAGLRTVMVVGKDKFQQLAVPGSLDTYIFAPGGDQDVLTNALTEVRRGFDLMLVHFPSVDLTGHFHSWMSDTYLRQVIAADAAVGTLMAALPPATTVIITADHGGKGFSHFSEQPEDVTIPWIISGPRVRRAHRIDSPISTTDTAATIAHLLGLTLPAGSVGRPILEALHPPEQAIPTSHGR